MINDNELAFYSDEVLVKYSFDADICQQKDYTTQKDF